MRAMLELWGKKLATPEVFDRALGVDLATFDKRFFAWLGSELAYLGKAYPFELRVYRAADDARAAEVMKAAETGDAAAQAEAAMMALARGDKGEALRWADLALATDGAAMKARYVRGLLALGDKDRRAQVEADWEALRAAGLAGVEGLGALAALAADAGDWARAAGLWAEAAALDPKAEMPLDRWAASLDKAGKPAEALGVRRKYLAIEQSDAGAAVKVLSALTEAKADEAAVLPSAEQALHVAPCAIEVHLARAKAFRMLGMVDAAKEAARIALAIDPTNAEAKALATP